MYVIDWQQVLGRPSKKGAAHRPSASSTVSEYAPRRRFLLGVSPVVWSLGFTSLLTDISSEMVASVLPMYLVLHLGISPFAFGVVDGLYQGVTVLLRVAAGFAGDRWRRHKTVAAAGYALSAICKLAMLAAGNAWIVIASVVALDRTGKGIRTAPRDALITLNSPSRDLAKAFGVHRALDAAGAMIGPLVAFMVLAALPGGFDVIFVASFGVAVLGLGVLLLFVNAPRRVDSIAAGPALSLASAIGLLREPRFRTLVITSGVLSLATMSDAFVFLVLQQRTGLNAAMFPLLYVGVSLVNFFMAIPGGGLADRFGRYRVLLAGHVLLLGVYGMLLLPGIGVAHIIVCLVLLGGYYAATDGVLTAMAGASLPESLCGSGLALVSTATNASRLAASMVFGWLWMSRGLDNAVIFFIVGLLVALTSAALTLGRTREPRSI